LKVLSLARSLSRELGAGFVVAPYPDHPELFSGPDILVGGGGRITAIFRLGRFTQKKWLYARVVAARLALPPWSVLVANVERGAEPEPVVIDSGFDFVLGDRELADLTGICKNGRRSDFSLSDLRTVQQRHALMYSTILQVALLRQRRKLEPTTVPLVMAALGDSEGQAFDSYEGAVEREPRREKKEPSNRFRSSGRLLRAIVHGTAVTGLVSRRQPTMRQVRTVWSEALASDFVFDSGVPYSRTANPRVVLVDSFPRSNRDPGKPTRSLAFGGLLLAVATTATDIVRLVDRVQEVTARRLNA
jgi:hypothetical protein